MSVGCFNLHRWRQECEHGRHRERRSRDEDKSGSMMWSRHFAARTRFRNAQELEAREDFRVNMIATREKRLFWESSHLELIDETRASGEPFRACANRLEAPRKYFDESPADRKEIARLYFADDAQCGGLARTLRGVRQTSLCPRREASRSTGTGAHCVDADLRHCLDASVRLSEACADDQSASKHAEMERTAFAVKWTLFCICANEPSAHDAAPRASVQTHHRLRLS